MTLHEPLLTPGMGATLLLAVIVMAIVLRVISDAFEVEDGE
jgi:hypothetical protein